MSLLSRNFSVNTFFSMLMQILTQNIERKITENTLNLKLFEPTSGPGLYFIDANYSKGRRACSPICLILLFQYLLKSQEIYLINISPMRFITIQRGPELITSEDIIFRINICNLYAVCLSFINSLNKFLTSSRKVFSVINVLWVRVWSRCTAVNNNL